MVTDEERAIQLLDYLGKKIAEYNKHFHSEDLGIAAVCLGDFAEKNKKTESVA